MAFILAVSDRASSLRLISEEKTLQVLSCFFTSTQITQSRREKSLKIKHKFQTIEILGL